VSSQELAAAAHERQTGCGLPIGDLRGFGRVRADASVAELALDRGRGLVLPSDPRRPLVALSLDGDAHWVSAYVPGTNVLESTARTPSGEVRVVDFMALAEGRPGQAEAIAAGRFVRLITCTEGEVVGAVAVAAEAAPTGGSGGSGGSGDFESSTEFAARAGWHLACSRPFTSGDGATTVSLRLRAGESVALVISDEAEQGGAPLVASALHALGDTIHYWTWWSDRCRYKGDDFDAVLREALTLKLAFSATGLQVEDPGATRFAAAPLGEMSRAAGRFLDLGYRHECAELLAYVHQHSPATVHGRWACEDSFVETLERYRTTYGDVGLAGALRDAAHVPPPQSRTA
jgi:hypothetical protein